MIVRPLALVPTLLALGLAVPLLAQSTTPLPPAKTSAEAAAQQQQGYSGPRAPDATGGNPGTTALNTHVAVGTSMQLEGNAAAQAQYSNDMEAYRKSLTATGSATVRDQSRYDNQRRAYADAMFAWRLQVRACERGHVKACKAPSPDPADFY
jgi:hypothetical protein